MALARIVTGAGVPVIVHVLTDGRDTAPDSAAGFVQTFEAALPEGARVGTVIGRYYAMDRDNRWERVSQAYDAMVSGAGARFASAQAAIAAAQGAGITDEFILPASIGGYAGMADGDGLVSFNFRADRVREILAALVDPAFRGFARSKTVAFAACTRYTLGGMPTNSVKRVLKVPSEEQPTAKQTSVTLRSPVRSRAMARSMRRVMR